MAAILGMLKPKKNEPQQQQEQHPPPPQQQPYGSNPPPAHNPHFHKQHSEPYGQPQPAYQQPPPQAYHQPPPPPQQQAHHRPPQQQQMQSSSGRPTFLNFGQQAQHPAPLGNEKQHFSLSADPMERDQRWSTTTCQCAGYDSCVEDWICALMFPPAAGAFARSNVDGSNCCFTCLTSLPPLHYNVVRRRYHIIGDDGEDAILGIFCMPCVLRQALTESRIRGRVQNYGMYRWEQKTQDTERWRRQLCDCTPETCCWAFFCPFCMSGEIRQRFDDASCWFTTFCGSPCATYNMVRTGFGIEGMEAMDLLLLFFAWPCALQQAQTEVTTRYLEQLTKRLGKCCSGGGGCCCC